MHRSKTAGNEQARYSRESNLIFDRLNKQHFRYLYSTKSHRINWLNINDLPNRDDFNNNISSSFLAILIVLQLVNPGNFATDLLTIEVDKLAKKNKVLPDFELGFSNCLKSLLIPNESSLASVATDRAYDEFSSSSESDSYPFKTFK